MRASKFQPLEPGVRQVTATRPGNVAVFRLDLVEEFRANDRSLGTGTFILGDQMKTLFAGLAFVLALAACENRAGRDTGQAGESADTSVTTRTTQDTTIVTSDTSIDTDTTVKEGDVKRDTAKH